MSLREKLRKGYTIVRNWNQGEKIIKSKESEKKINNNDNNKKNLVQNFQVLYPSGLLMK